MTDAKLNGMRTGEAKWTSVRRTKRKMRRRGARSKRITGAARTLAVMENF